MAVQKTERRRSRLSHIDKAEDEYREHIDFKMVTFSLGGKDYGIDIMKVKEIAKYSQFTYVPNAPHFVQGVYNLRGDIISIVDLRRMFNLPVDDTDPEDGRNGLILRLESNMLGIVVDKIDKVVGISSGSIQPPHPIFGDINIKFISGVVEHENRLYIILDVERIFSRDDEEEGQKDAAVKKAPQHAPVAQTPQKHAQAAAEDVDKGFVLETLKTFAGFHVSPVNSQWVEKRYTAWRKERSEAGVSIQLEGETDAQEFLRDFHSPYTAQIWGEGYCSQLARFLPESPGKTITVWNPGCGKGYETYSLVCLLKQQFPDSAVKVWAVDKDLMAISAAPTMAIDKDSVPPDFQHFLTQGTKGHGFSSEISDAILFEYSDIANGSTVPSCDIILARDLLSYLPESQQLSLLESFQEKLKPNGVLFLGKNEYPVGDGWNYIGKDAVSAANKR
ncbi:chemotaxis protein CheW [Spirochaeta africana]|uniref:Chemotaxis signal transduction protein n=1 Tax=Spirochaeta africana (strain ATCC 700263 / DSM 8902 / Z-7692) TaxID=889378 RepID=H9UJN4_SPIAZ|nr:chemotaxis protein CheW [Spirochaeta africana]AFG37727.1 chemotaxis signal transduction protein [Spirochaeta africana DSM 8902]